MDPMDVVEEDDLPLHHAVDWTNGLPPEVAINIFSLTPISSLGRAAAVCQAWKALVTDDELWRGLLMTIFVREATSYSFTDETTVPREIFQQVLKGYEKIRKPLSEPHGWLNISEGERGQELKWLGPEDKARGNTVGLAMIGDMLNAWPCVSKRHWKNYRLDYYEVEVKNAGSHGYIAVGWATDRFRNSQKQPGWVADTYGYHGDDGCAYSGYGYGRRFGPRFTTGQIVGTGIVYGGTGRRIFYTLDGELVGTPFGNKYNSSDEYNMGIGVGVTAGSSAISSSPKAIDDESLILIPAIGLHSPGEHVSVNFGGRVNDLLNASPPKQLQPFAFDVNAYLLQLSEEEAQRERDEQAIRNAAREGRPPPPPPTEAVPVVRPQNPEANALLNILPWALHDVVLIATRDMGAGSASPMSDDDRDEMLRYATSRLPGGGIGLHPSWGATSIHELERTKLCDLGVALLQREAARVFQQQLAGARGRGRGRGGGGGAGGRGRGRGPAGSSDDSDEPAEAHGGGM